MRVSLGLLVFTLLSAMLGAPIRSASAEDVTISRVIISNVDDRSFAVSWVTDQPADGYVRYGEDLAQSDTWTRVEDVRGVGYTGYTHYVSVENGDPAPVEAGRAYVLALTSGNTTMTAKDSPLLIARTGAATTTTTPSPNFFSGTVRYHEGNPARGVLVLVTLQRPVPGGPGETSMPLSGLTDDSGAFSVDVGRARIARDIMNLPYFYLSTTSSDEKVVYELDAGGDNRLVGTVDANTTSAGSAASTEPRMLTLPLSEGSSVQLTPAATGVVLPTPPPVAPTVSPVALPATPTPLPTRPTAPPTMVASPTGGASTPVLSPGSTPTAVAAEATPTPPSAAPGTPATPTPSPTTADAQRLPPSILAVIGAAVLLITTGLALAVVGLAEARRQ